MSAVRRPRVGILMLDTRFPRPPGDIGHPQSFTTLGIEPLYKVVRGASPRRVIETRDPSLIEAFVAAGQDLVREGAERIGTSCGFLARFQHELARALPVPVVSSSLLACARVSAPGILTFSAQALDSELLQAASVPPGTPIESIDPAGEFCTRILNNESHMDVTLAEREVVHAARQLIQRHPQIKTIVLECTNLPPYRAAIEAATGCATMDALRMLAHGLRAEDPGGDP